MIRVVVAEDSQIVRKGLIATLKEDNEIDVVGCAGNGMEALELCDKLLPDLVLMDIKMPVCDGVKGTKLIKDKHYSIKVIILTTFDDGEYINQALNNGADGYILKDISDHELITTIKGVVNGLSIIQSSVFSKIVHQNAQSAGAKNPEVSPLVESLNGREIDVIKLIVEGKNNKDISANLHLADGTVRNTIHIILEKLNLEDRTQLAVFAIRNGIV